MARRNHITRRKSKSRQENKIFLIVTEDTESAYNYFQILKKENRLPTLNIEIKPSKKPAPDQVVSFTKIKAKELGAELSFCIIDRDTHEHFDKAINDANKIKDLEVIASYPCFEYWIILHHNKDCYKPMNAKECIRETTNRFKTYEKSMDNKSWLNFYNSELVSNQDTAIEKAISAEKKCQESNTENPKTDIYKLFNTKGYPFYKDCK
ncbi:RloB family protein [Francisella tularensis]|uniref:RloB family protein n=1 Tax=Francisella tularensis TaxID=263 RepID=UPI001C0EDD3D|nr:RloB family protein [Francisella tularensis]MBK2109691.1 RloB domain-containing protein [Francisella tularensis subsp. novicida FSC595]